MADIDTLRNALIADPDPEGFRPVRLQTIGGEVSTRWYAPPGAATGAAVLCVGGAGGGFDTPANGLYPALLADLAGEGMAGLRVRFRNPRDIDMATRDVLAGIEFLRRQGATRFGLVGHSLGGAVVLRAAAEDENVVAVVGLASQSHGADAARRLGNRCAVLLIHGTDDEILPDACSVQIHRLLTGSRRLVHIEGGRHVLDEASDQVRRETERWLRMHL